MAGPRDDRILAAVASIVAGVIGGPQDEACRVLTDEDERNTDSELTAWSDVWIDDEQESVVGTPDAFGSALWEHEGAVVIHVCVRDEDPKTRQDMLSRIVNTLRKELNFKDFGGLVDPGTTRLIGRVKDDEARPPVSAVYATLEYSYDSTDEERDTTEE